MMIIMQLIKDMQFFMQLGNSENCITLQVAMGNLHIFCNNLIHGSKECRAAIVLFLTKFNYIGDAAFYLSDNIMKRRGQFIFFFLKLAGCKIG